MRARALALVWAAALAAACAARPPPATRPPAGGPPAPGPPPIAAPASPAPPPAPGDYGHEPEVTLEPLEAEALAALPPRLAPSRPARARTSTALVLAARELARRAAEGSPAPLDAAAVRGALARGLAADPGPAAYLVVDRPDRLVEAALDVVPEGDATHLGAGVALRGPTAFLVVLTSRRRVALDPFPRSVAPGSTARLSGRLAAGLVHPRAFATAPSGEVSELEVRGGSAFTATARFPSEGRWLLEVVGEGASGPEVVALLVVSAGGAPLDAPAAAAGPAGADDPDAPGSVVRAINAVRARHRLAPLRADPAVAEVARRHSEAMLAAGRLAHVLPGSGGPGERLGAARIPFTTVRENVAQARTALEAHAAAEESPAHRANLLDPAVTRVGVGVARGRFPSGQPTTYLTEILMSGPGEAGEPDRLTPDARVRVSLWDERARRRLLPLTADARLDAIADRAAALLLESDGVSAGDPGAEALGLPRRLAAVDLFAVASPQDAARSANLPDARLTRVGVGVREGDSRRLGGRRLFIVVVYSD